MAHSPFSLLLLRRLSLSSPNPRLSRLFAAIKPFSTSPSPSSSSASSSSPESGPPSSLSARMSFVFDQIDAIERERSEKDETLQRIRAWREAKNAQNPGLDSGISKHGETAANSADSEPREAEPERPSKAQAKSELELVHPWPEWIELMERLVQQNYFDHRRKDEDKMIHDLGFDSSLPGNSRVSDSSGLDFKNFKLVQTACLNFGKDRFDILRSLSRQDIQILVGFGCPSADKKVVFSAKLLRKHVHLDEGDVCSSCSLRNSCDRAYLLTLKEEEARTIDIMRVLLAYGFDLLNDTALNQSLLKQKSVKNVVRKLLHQVVKLSSVPIDPNLPPPIIKKPPPKVKQPPPPPKKRVGRDDIEMKKGDWLCPKCDFMNFAKNTVCLQCDAKRPKRQLLPGEWECPQCNFLNYRRNMVCFHCESKRPPDEFTESKMQENQEGPRMRTEKTTNRSEVSNAWNFDFDDDESDGADVAAFEYADSSVIAKGSLDNQAPGGNFRGPESDFNKNSRAVRVQDIEYSDAGNGRPSVGFDDFDDEEDDVDNYEIDTGNKSSVRMISSNDLSEVEGDSGSEDSLGTGNYLHTRDRTNSPSYNKQSKSMHRRAFSGSDDDEDDLESKDELSARPNSSHGTKYPSYNKQSRVMQRKRAFSGSEDDELDSDSDSELSANPKWKSSHVADSRPRGRGKGPSKGLSFGFGSDDELGLDSDVDDDLDRNFGSNRGKANGFRRQASSGTKDPFSDSESENDGSHSYGNKFGRNAGPNRRGRDPKGRGSFNSTRDAKFRPNGMKNDRRNSFEDDPKGRGSFNSTRDAKFRPNGMKNDRRNSFEDDSKGRGSFKSTRDAKFKSNRTKNNKRNSFEDNDDEFGRSSQGSRGRGFRGNSFGSRMNAREGGSRNFKEPRNGGFRKQQGGRHGRDIDDSGPNEFKNSRRVIER